MARRVRYPRTYHLPDSPGAAGGDGVQRDLSWLDGELVVTEKLDGGNLTFTRDAVYARSPDSGTHPWDRPAKALWVMTAHRIPDGWRVCGESMWARRSIAYRDLPGVFIVFGIWDETHTLLGWDDTVDWAHRLELPVVPVLYRGGSLTEARAAWAAQRDAATSEGYVVRSAGRIPAADFPLRLLKWVRAAPVGTSAARRRRDDFARNEFA
jgi:RNA ligase